MLLSKKDIQKLIKSESQSLREKDNFASKVVPQLDIHKEKYIELLSKQFELHQNEVSELENIYKIIPDEVISRKIKGKASEQLHNIMTADLSKLLNIQLDKNTSEINEDKQQLEIALTALDELSASLSEVIKLHHCKVCTPWRGAELLVMGLNESSSKENNLSWVVVKTQYQNEISYIITESYKISEYFMDHMSKYVFCEMLGNAANKYDGDDLIGLLKSVIVAAKECITGMHINFIYSLNERVTDRNIKLFG